MKPTADRQCVEVDRRCLVTLLAARDRVREALQREEERGTDLDLARVSFLGRVVDLVEECDFLGQECLPATQ
jgi:hypothetical protein